MPATMSFWATKYFIFYSKNPADAEKAQEQWFNYVVRQQRIVGPHQIHHILLRARRHRPWFASPLELETTLDKIWHCFMAFATVSEGLHKYMLNCTILVLFMVPFDDLTIVGIVTIRRTWIRLVPRLKCRFSRFRQITGVCTIACTR